MNDERLARRAAAGDERAFAAIFRRYQQDLYRYCLAILGNSADAQDALQNTMVKALRSLPGEERRIALKPWLYRVAHNESVDMLRQRRGEPLDPEAAAPGTGLAETAARRERLRGLLADLGRLPERQRGALVMRELSGLDFEQIGTALGTSASTARQTVYEARRGLREMEAGREMSCETVTRAISDGDGRTLRRRDVRAHLHACPECRAFRTGIEQRRGDLAALSPLPAVAAAALLKGALGAAGTGAGAAASGAAAGGAAVTSGAAGALGTGGGIGVAAKAAATVAAVAAIGVGAADRTGLVHVTGSGGNDTAKTAPADAGGSPVPPAAARVAGPTEAARVAEAARAPERPAHSGQESDPASHARTGSAGGRDPDGGDNPHQSSGSSAHEGKGPPDRPGRNGKARGHENGHRNAGAKHAAAGGAPGQEKKASKGKAAKEPKSTPSGKGSTKQSGTAGPHHAQGAPPSKAPTTQPDKGATASPPASPEQAAPPEAQAVNPPAGGSEAPGKGRPEDDPGSSP
jgi:RNA polymerase sigma factor (sigma-70 family)